MKTPKLKTVVLMPGTEVSFVKETEVGCSKRVTIVLSERREVPLLFVTNLEEGRFVIAWPDSISGQARATEPKSAP